MTSYPSLSCAYLAKIGGQTRRLQVQRFVVLAREVVQTEKHTLFKMRTTRLTLVFSTIIAGLASAAIPELPASCPQILPAPAPSSLPSYFIPKIISASQSGDIETIRQTLHYYALVLDTKAFPQLNRVFASGATANFSGLAGFVEGLPAIQSFLSNQLSDYPRTQHLTGNHIIDVCASNFAVSQTYFQATHFPANSTGTIPTAYVTHQDVWERAQNGWRIVYSNFGITVSDLCAAVPTVIESLLTQFRDGDRRSSLSFLNVRIKELLRN